MKSIEDYGYVDFKTIKEEWSEYVLEDGTIIRTKSVLLKVVKAGHDEFNFNERSFATSFSPPELKGQAGPKISPEEIAEIVKSVKKEDVNVLIAKEHWNEYELSSGEKFSSKAVLVSASLTDRHDDIGDPIYGVQLSILHKLFPNKADKVGKI